MGQWLHLCLDELELRARKGLGSTAGQTWDLHTRQQFALAVWCPCTWHCGQQFWVLWCSRGTSCADVAPLNGQRALGLPLLAALCLQELLPEVLES